jgi:hypothetical protein
VSASRIDAENWIFESSEETASDRRAGRLTHFAPTAWWSHRTQKETAIDALTWPREVGAPRGSAAVLPHRVDASTPARPQGARSLSIGLLVCFQNSLVAAVRGDVVRLPIRAIGVRFARQQPTDVSLRTRRPRTGRGHSRTQSLRQGRRSTPRSGSPARIRRSSSSRSRSTTRLPFPGDVAGRAPEHPLRVVFAHRR